MKYTARDAARDSIRDLVTELRTTPQEANDLGDWPAYRTNVTNSLRRIWRERNGAQSREVSAVVTGRAVFTSIA